MFDYPRLKSQNHYKKASVRLIRTMRDDETAEAEYGIRIDGWL